MVSFFFWNIRCFANNRRHGGNVCTVVTIAEHFIGRLAKQAVWFTVILSPNKPAGPPTSLVKAASVPVAWCVFERLWEGDALPIPDAQWFFISVIFNHCALAHWCAMKGPKLCLRKFGAQWLEITQNLFQVQVLQLCFWGNRQRGICYYRQFP